MGLFNWGKKATLANSMQSLVNMIAPVLQKNSTLDLYESIQYSERVVKSALAQFPSVHNVEATETFLQVFAATATAHAMHERRQHKDIGSQEALFKTCCDLFDQYQFVSNKKFDDKLCQMFISFCQEQSYFSMLVLQSAVYFFTDREKTTWDEWYADFKRGASTVNDQCAVGEDGGSIIDFMEDDWMKARFADGVDPFLAAAAFAKGYDFLKVNEIKKKFTQP